MKKNYNVQGKDRKSMAQLIGSWLNTEVKYAGIPTYAYRIGEFTVDRNGSLEFNDGLDQETVSGLLEHLEANGYHSEADGNTTDTLTITFPDKDMDREAIERLIALTTAKKTLFTKAFDAVSTSVIWDESNHTIQFPWFKTENVEDNDTYILFLQKLMEFAKSLKRASAKENEAENEKYAFRCFLLRLGFIGKEYKDARKVLLSKLTGNTAFKRKDGE